MSPTMACGAKYHTPSRATSKPIVNLPRASSTTSTAKVAPEEEPLSAWEPESSTTTDLGGASAIERLTMLIYTLPDGHELLQNIGAKLMSVGICSDAVKAFVKSGNISLAVDCCVTLNQWQND